MSNILNQISNHLKNTFKDPLINIKGDTSHIFIEIVTDSFDDLSIQKRHAIVNNSLKDFIENKVHSIELITKTKKEHSSNKNTVKNKYTEKYIPSIDLNTQLLKDLHNVIQTYDVVLFMKGTIKQPMCGFSSLVCDILNSLNIKYNGVNVLSSDDLRQSVKLYSNWNTFPQLYIKGIFIGGADIIKNLYESEELQKIIKNNNIEYKE